MSAVLIRHLRERHGLSQSELAVIANVSQSLISQVEKGNRHLPARAIQSLREHFGDEVVVLPTTSDACEILGHLTEAWEAYDETQRVLSGLVALLQKSAAALQSHQRELDRVLPSVAERNALDNLIGIAAREKLERIDASTLPRSSHPKYLDLPKGARMSRKHFSGLMDLLSAASQLRQVDVELLMNIAIRLGDTQTAKMLVADYGSPSSDEIYLEDEAES